METKVAYLSTSKLATKHKKSVKEMFNILLEKELVEKEEENWMLTKKGESIGGIIKKHFKAGEYIAWDVERIEEILIKSTNDETYINATTISSHFGISRNKINPIFAELGFIEKEGNGWIVTLLGEKNGGKQLKYDRTGIPFVNWKKSILTHKAVLEAIEAIGTNESKKNETQVETNNVNHHSITFRDKFEATYRTMDGHYVRSRAEVLIDNWLYMYGIVHAYERKLPIEQEAYCDFYLPSGRVYIEYWGLENDAKYKQRKERKLEIYKENGFNLIEIQDADIKNLDDILPKKLLAYGVRMN
ncbi:glycerol kinase [Niallia circulans]|uniref:glycerol kinase n=1 Tax=Niallia circulans TaxID=1397 RepID=UPI000F450FE7|nr:glycerol kinase [Niallia circulans]AYV67631.1 glycerol kinase [Niallia circulans]